MFLWMNYHAKGSSPHCGRTFPIPGNRKIDVMPPDSADFLAGKQKIAQGFVIWLVPIFGVIRPRIFRVRTKRSMSPDEGVGGSQ